jgi:hypothetical protein
MSAEPPVKGKKLADFLRRNTAVPTQSFFRALNFELYTRCGCTRFALEATAGRGCAQKLNSVFVSRVCACALRRRGNTAIAVPGTLLCVGVFAYFAMMHSDEAARQRERLAADPSRREELE